MKNFIVSICFLICVSSCTKKIEISTLNQLSKYEINTPEHVAAILEKLKLDKKFDTLFQIFNLTLVESRRIQGVESFPNDLEYLATIKDTIGLVKFLNQSGKSYLNQLIQMINRDYEIQARIASTYPYLVKLSNDNLRIVITGLINNYEKKNISKQLLFSVNKNNEIITYDEFLESFDDKCSDMLLRLLERCDRNADLVYGLCFTTLEFPPAFIACVLGAIAQNNWCHNDAKEDYQLCKQGRL